MRRLLVLSQFYRPENHDKATQIANAFVDEGYDVTAVTAFPNYPLGKIYPGYKLSPWMRETMFGVKVVRLPIYATHSGSALHRGLHFASFSLAATLLGPFFAGKPDLLWVYHPPLTIGIPAWWISRMKRIPFVYDVQDMWPETLTDNGMTAEDSLIVRGLNRLADFTYRSAAAISVCSPGFKRNLIAKGVPADKIHLIHYWIDEVMFAPRERDAAFGHEHGLDGRFNIMFTGNLGPAQALESVIEAAERVQDLEDVQFVFVGDGLHLPLLQQQAEKARLKNVRFIARQPIEKMAEFLAWGDVLLFHLRIQPLHDITIPSKIYHYMASGRPLLCAAPGDSADIVRETGCGLVCEPQNAEAIAHAVRELHAMPAEGRAQLGQAARHAFETQFSQRVLLGKYHTLFEQVVQDHNTRAR